MSSSRSACSSSESTSLRVESTYCDSTTRQADRSIFRGLKLAAHRVQILGDMNEPLDRSHALGRHAAQVVVLGVKPDSRLRLAADQGVEAAVHAHEEERELALFPLDVEQLAARKARHRRLAHTEDA